ncbi:MAG: hypothetical protein LBD20_00595 [Spirochaetaceae bacterium]|nr:hypothetical protein [Spirochaetaceae bacterium]
MKAAKSFFGRIFTAITAALALGACSVKKAGETAPLAEAARAGDVQAAVVEQARVLFSQPPGAVMRLDGEPCWFEFVAGLPRQIGRPEDAALKDFKPWPQAVHAAGLLPFYDGLVAAVNRCGLLALVSGGGGDVLMYVFTKADFFANYTTAALFYFDGAPAVLLSANDFFLESELPPPEPRAFMLSAGENALLELDIPAFQPYPPAEGWNIEQIFPTAAGLWYFSARQKNKGRDNTFYGRTESSGTSIKVEGLSSGQFYQAKQPSPAENLPPVIKTLLQSSGLTGGIFWTITVSSKEEGGSLVFSSGGAGGEGDSADEAGTAALHAAYSDGDDTNGAVLLIPAIESGWPQAAVFFYDAYGTVQRRNLPPLPPAFFWTGIGDCGTAIAAFWEERDNWHIGAAGFLLIN